MKLLIRFGIFVSLLWAGHLLAAELEPALQSRLNAADADHWFSVIVKLHSPRDIVALDQQLHVQKASKADRHRIVLHALHLNAEETQGPVIARLQRMETQGLVEGFTAFWIENLIVVYGKTDAILALASDPAVESIGYNFKASLIEPVARGPIRGSSPLDNETIVIGQRATGAARVNNELGFTGRGVIIAGLDTGVDAAHHALHDRWRGLTHPLAECWLDLLGNSPNGPTDTGSHGTHTMGTMTGREIRTNGDTLTIGAAPEAEWISCNAINQGVGRPFDQDVLDAFQWLADPDGDSTTVDDMPDVVQNSWGVFANIGNDPTYTACFSNWNGAITDCEAAGVVVIFSAGNEGSSGLRSPAKFQLSPTDMFSVGAVDLSSDSLPPYPIATFSSLGPSGCPPDSTAIKPEICAPGVNVYSSIPGNAYTLMSGTSMAGPHISGIVALMREACPNCDPQTIKEALISTAVRTGYVVPPATENNTFGNGFVDAYAAVLAISSLGRVDGYVTLQNGTPLPGVSVHAVGTLGSGLTNDAGYYSLVIVNEGNYTVNYTKFAYQNFTQNNVQITTGDTTHVNVTMTPAATGVLAGTVVMQSGIPVQGALVSFTATPLDTLVTDANGRFVQVLPANPYNVHVKLTINTIPPRVVNTDVPDTVTAGDTTHATLTLSVNLVDPSPADAYGYRAYDRYDRDLPCPYDWQELAGRGTEFTFVQHDSSDYFPAPFPITFYGESSDSLTVNCNGWMLPGIHHDTGATDRPIPYNNPDAPTPPGIIAPLWNNFRSGGPSHQYGLYDTLQSRWIFEFTDQRLVSPSNYFNNWEVQILDPALYPTATGDCEILFIYGVLQYQMTSTVGIEHPARTMGIQVLHDTLSSWSWPVEIGAAIRFTTGRATQVGGATVNLTLYPPPQNGDLMSVIIGGRAVSQAYPAPLVADSVPAAPVSGLLVTPGYERSRVDHVIVPPGGMATAAIEAWRLDPPQNFSSSQAAHAVTLHWSLPASVQFHDYAALTYRIYRNDTLLATAAHDEVTFTDQPFPDSTRLTYRVDAMYRYGKGSAALNLTIGLNARPVENSLPMVYSLYPNFPNPFNPDTRIRLDVPSTCTGKLEVYDLQGRLVRTLWSGSLSAGRYQYTWNSRDERGRGVASGLYFCRFSSPQYTATQKMMLIK